MLVVAREQDGDVTTTAAVLDLNEDTDTYEMRLELGPLAFIVGLDRAAELAEQIRDQLIEANYFAPPQFHRAV
jgi:hypothetical protein